MKKLFYAATLALSLFTCKDQNEIEQRQAGLNERVGAQISLETARRWTERLETQQGNSASREKTDEPISSLFLYEFLSDIEANLGIAFHYGLDINGDIHLLAIKYNIETSWEGMAFDLRTKSLINLSEAHILCDRYKKDNVVGPWSHFFGKIVITDILSKPNFTSFQLVPAINDENEKQLLLYIWLAQEIASGRTLQQTVEVYDKGNPCPPDCANE